MINILIVTNDASFIAFQADDYTSGAQQVDKMLADPFYSRDGRITTASPVFLKDTDIRADLEQHTIGSMVRDLLGKEAGR